MKAVILVGGMGTRLRPLTTAVPKSMVPVLGVPAIEHTLVYLRQFGIKDVILTLSYLPDAISNALGDGSQLGMNLVYCFEKEPLGTAGAVKNTEKYLDDDSVLVLNGDIFTDLDLADMIASHKRRGAAATISLTWVEDPSSYGVVEMDDTRKVKAFIEKPPRQEARTNWVNAGTYILDRKVIELIPPGQHHMFERGLFPALLADGNPVYGYPHRGYWLDMGTPGRYYQLNMDMLSGKYRSPVIDMNSEVLVCLGASIHHDACIKGPVIIEQDVKISAGADIRGPAVIGKGSFIGECASINASILWHNVIVENGATVGESIVAGHSCVPAGTVHLKQVVTSVESVNLTH